MKPIQVTREQKLGGGAYAAVYRVSKNRVVKVFYAKFGKKAQERLIEDEVNGSRRHPMCLPVLKVVDIQAPGSKRTRKGLLKRYLPYETDYEEMKNYGKKHYGIDPYREFWDAHEDNFRKDSKGRIFMVDTQVKPWV